VLAKGLSTTTGWIEWAPWQERNNIIGLQWSQVRGRTVAAEGDGSSECELRSEPEIGKSPVGLTLLLLWVKLESIHPEILN
jgi:hypothetical protein